MMTLTNCDDYTMQFRRLLVLRKESIATHICHSSSPMPFNSKQNHQILNHPSLVLNASTIVALKYNKISLLGMIAFSALLNRHYFSLFSNKILRHKIPKNCQQVLFSSFFFFKCLNKCSSHKMENSLPWENDNSLQGRILNNSCKDTYSLRVDKLLHWKPGHITLSLNAQIERQLTKVNF